MKNKIGILIILLLFIVFGCTKYWDEHYNTQPETINTNVWDAIQNDPDVSVFVNKVKVFKLDTLFLSDNSYTLFIPNNAALNAYLSTDTLNSTRLSYLIAEQYIQPVDISGNRKILTYSKKFAVITRSGNKTIYDGVETDSESPLYLNGKYFKMSHIPLPKPNLYEYIALNNPILRKFIDELDTIVLDNEKSIPIGYDSLGRTVYDSVVQVINMFEEELFPIKHEFRAKTATIAFPVGEVYNNALTSMAQNLGGSFVDYRDIPYEWQKKILIPRLLYQGVFENSIEEQEFLKQYEGDSVKLKNILGDSIGIGYIPTGKTVCSNGYFYGYSNYSIPDSLYTGSTLQEGEWLLKSAGINKYAWFPEVKVACDISLTPIKEYNNYASNDSLLKLNFPSKYKGKFELEFYTRQYLFPRKYLMVVGTHMDVGGKYDIYVNDELVKSMDYYSYVIGRSIYYSVYNNERVGPNPANSRFNIFDCWVESIWEYGPAKIKIVYTGPSNLVSNCGLVIDFIDFIPESSFTGYEHYRK
jgi:hypothetical protein